MANLNSRMTKSISYIIWFALLSMLLTGCLSTISYTYPTDADVSRISNIQRIAIGLKVIDNRSDAEHYASKIPLVYYYSHKPIGQSYSVSPSVLELFEGGFRTALQQKGFEVNSYADYEFQVRIKELLFKGRATAPSGKGSIEGVSVTLEVVLVNNRTSAVIFSRTVQEEANKIIPGIFIGDNKDLIPAAMDKIITAAVEIRELATFVAQLTSQPTTTTPTFTAQQPATATKVSEPLVVFNTGSDGSDTHMSPLPKTALIIGNGDYQHFPRIMNPVSEAKALASVLRSLGFTVFEYTNLDYEQMYDALSLFESHVKAVRGLAFFHYGGHGIQVDGQNYLIPVNADIPDENRVRSRAIQFQEVASALEASGSYANIMILDACRDNPLASSTRSGTRGLSVVSSQPPNSVLVYAAEAGTQAIDGVFTPILIKYLEQEPELEFSVMLRKVRSDVWSITKGVQRPGEYNQLISEIHLSEDQPITE